MNQDLVRNNIEELLSTCDRYINTIGEYSYTELSYSGSYAFVILSGIVKNYRFALERMQIAKEFEQYWL